MSVKIDHTHPDGKVCIAITGRHVQGVSKLTKVVYCEFESYNFFVGYMPFAGKWHAFDPQTGEEIARFDQDFYDSFIQQFEIGDTSPAHNCKTTPLPVKDEAND